MTGNDVLAVLLARIAAAPDCLVAVPEEEVAGWPKRVVKALIEAGLLRQTEFATALTCPGCERMCSMPVDLVGEGHATKAFIVCDKEEDFGPIPVPLEALRCWQASAEAVAARLTTALGVQRRPGMRLAPGKWEVGVRRGKPQAQFLLCCEDELMIEVAGYRVPARNVLCFRGVKLEISTAELEWRIENPALNGSEQETPAEHDARVYALVEKNRARHPNTFIKATATELGCSRQAVYRRCWSHLNRVGGRR